MADDEHLTSEIAKLEADTLPIARAAATYAIVDQESMEGAIDFLGKVKEAHDKVERTRKFFVGPLLELKRKYDARFTPALDELEGAEKTLKGKMTDYRLTLRADEAAKTVRTQDAKVTFVKKWKHKVVDASKVPDAFWKIDDDRIAEQVKAGLRTIPGIEIYEVEEARSTYA